MWLTSHGTCVGQSNLLTIVTCRVVVVIVVITETFALLTGQMFSWTAFLTPITRLQKFKTYQDVENVQLSFII